MSRKAAKGNRYSERKLDGPEWPEHILAIQLRCKIADLSLLLSRERPPSGGNAPRIRESFYVHKNWVRAGRLEAAREQQIISYTLGLRAVPEWLDGAGAGSWDGREERAGAGSGRPDGVLDLTWNYYLLVIAHTRNGRSAIIISGRRRLVGPSATDRPPLAIARRCLLPSSRLRRRCPISPAS